MAKQLILEGLDSYSAPGYSGLQSLQNHYGPLENFIPSVVSLITLSLDSEGEYLGCAHRHAPEQRNIVSAEFSSPGFFRFSPAAGNWRAVINVHAVVSPEVRYRLQILAYEGEK